VQIVRAESTRRSLIMVTIPLMFAAGGVWGDGNSSDHSLKSAWEFGHPFLRSSELSLLPFGESGGRVTTRGTESLLTTGLSLRGLGSGDGGNDTDRGGHLAKAASNSITPFLVLGELSLLSDGKNGRAEARTGARAILATSLITQALKGVSREKRPDSDSRDSFPSGHTSTAFAMATVLAEYQPKYKWLAYGVASIIGWSRIETDAHHWQDVVAGAALGYYVALHFADKHATISPTGLTLHWEW
jgi:hypothetical protein